MSENKVNDKAFKIKLYFDSYKYVYIYIYIYIYLYMHVYICIYTLYILYV